MVATLVKDRPDLRVQKTETELAARRWIESQGGLFLKINWAKLKIHYLTASGHKAMIDVSPTIPDERK